MINYNIKRERKGGRIRIFFLGEKRGERLGLAVEEGERLGLRLVLLPRDYREGT